VFLKIFVQGGPQIGAHLLRNFFGLKLLRQTYQTLRLFESYCFASGKLVIL
jgi:hypothetical protein